LNIFLPLHRLDVAGGHLASEVGLLKTGYYFSMDEAERFVRDAMSFAGFAAADGRRHSMFGFTKSTVRRLRRLLVGRRRRNEGEDPYSYVGAPLKPKPPHLKSALRLPLP
jgi:hypothetical protein